MIAFLLITATIAYVVDDLLKDHKHRGILWTYIVAALMLAGYMWINN
jgi:hypothetical protein